MLYFLGRKSCDTFVQPAFFSWREIAQEMTWPLTSRSKTCLPLVFNYFIAEGFCLSIIHGDHNAQFLVNCF